MENDDNNKLLKKVENYLIEILEKPRPEYEGLPACPFIKKQRIRNKLLIDIFDNNKESFLDKMNLFVNSQYTDAVFAQRIDDALSTQDSKEYQDFLNRVLREHFNKYKVIVTNPHDKFEVMGFNPRSHAPCFLIVVTDKEKLARTHKQMLKSKYFSNFDDDYLNYLHVKREELNLK